MLGGNVVRLFGEARAGRAQTIVTEASPPTSIGERTGGLTSI